MVPNFDGLEGCFKVLLVLAAVGVIAIAVAGWWVVQRIDIQWSEPTTEQPRTDAGGEGWTWTSRFGSRST
jgi:hypothetical protein